VKEYLYAVMPAVNASAIMAVAVLFAYRFLPSANRPVVNLALIVLVGALFYSGALLAFHRHRVIRLYQAIRDMLQRRRVTA